MKKSILSYLLKKGFTSKMAAERIGVSKKYLLRWAKRYELSFPFRKGTPMILDTSKVKCLLKRGYSNRDIDKIFNVRYGVTKIFRYRNGLEYKTGIPYYKYKLPINNEIRSIIIGTVLGDGHISKEGTLSCTHSLKQLNYCKWKSDKLSAKFKINNPRFDIRTEKTYYSCTFAKKADAYTRSLRKELYQPDKQLTSESLEYYNALSLAIHYMDDGYKTSNSYKLATNSFTIDSLGIFNAHCKKELGIRFAVHSENKLYLPIKYKSIFESLVKPYMHPELAYKLHSQ